MDLVSELSIHNLVLLFGMPRSGTTWIGKIFDSHPDVFYLHEPLHHCSNNFPYFISDSEFSLYEEQLRADVTQAFKTPFVGNLTKTPSFRKGFARLPFNLSPSVSNFACKVIARLYPEKKIPEKVFNRSKPFVGVWKSVKYLGRINALCRIAETAVPILILRHPGGQIASIIRGTGSMSSTAAFEKFNYFDDALKLGIPQHYGLTRDSLINCSIVGRLAWQWVLINHAAVVATISHNGSLCNYDRLANNPSQAITLLEHIGLNNHEQTTKFIRQSSNTPSSTYFSVNRDSRTASNRWREQLSKSDIHEIDTIVKDSLPWKYYEEMLHRPE